MSKNECKCNDHCDCAGQDKRDTKPQWRQGLSCEPNDNGTEDREASPSHGKHNAPFETPEVRPLVQETIVCATRRVQLAAR